jgi:hypothetical protein
MYICIYVYLYMCTSYACMYVCMYVCIYVCACVRATSVYGGGGLWWCVGGGGLWGGSWTAAFESADYLIMAAPRNKLDKNTKNSKTEMDNSMEEGLDCHFLRISFFFWRIEKDYFFIRKKRLLTGHPAFLTPSSFSLLNELIQLFPFSAFVFFFFSLGIFFFSLSIF